MFVGMSKGPAASTGWGVAFRRPNRSPRRRISRAADEAVVPEVVVEAGLERRRPGHAARLRMPRRTRKATPTSCRNNPVAAPAVAVAPGYLNPDSGGVHFVISPTEALFAGERGGVRHIYMDGRAHRHRRPRPGQDTPSAHSREACSWSTRPA